MFLGILQSIVGWWMVKSGLANTQDVSHYRLATHLILALIIFRLRLIDLAKYLIL